MSQKDLETLFGKGYQLKKMRQLTQPSDFAAEETITIEANGKKIEKIRVIGPLRQKTQPELSITDVFGLGIDINNVSMAIKGPKGEIEYRKGPIIAYRHIHCTPDEAKGLGLKNGQFVSVKIDGERGVVFNNVKIRVRDDYKLCLHLDTDEGNAAGINKTGEGVIIL